MLSPKQKELLRELRDPNTVLARFDISPHACLINLYEKDPTPVHLGTVKALKRKGYLLGPRFDKERHLYIYYPTDILKMFWEKGFVLK